MIRSIGKTVTKWVLAAVPLTFAASAAAQTTTTHRTLDAPVVTKQQIKAEVTAISANTLVGKVIPSGEHRVFTIRSGQKFIIDGATKALADIKKGTVLTADVYTTKTPVLKRTTTVTNGTVWHVQGNTVIVTLESGENKEYTVEPDYKFVVEGKPASVNELKDGMKVSGTKIVEEPTLEIQKDAVITGTAPK